MDVKNIKSIEQLIKFLNEMYLYSKDSTNYGEELQTMKEMKKVPSMVKKCKKIEYAIRWEPYYFRNENLLWKYLNECIVGCYKRSNGTSVKYFCNAYINVRNVDNADSVKQKLIEIATNRGINVLESCRKIDEAWEKFFRYKKEISKYSWDSNGYNQILPKIKAAGEWLTDKNYVPSVIYWDLLSSSNNIETTVFYDYLQLEKSEMEVEVEEKNNLSEKDKKDALWGCGGVIGIVLFLVGIAYCPFITIGIIALFAIAGFIIRFINKRKNE